MFLATACTSPVSCGRRLKMTGLTDAHAEDLCSAHSLQQLLTDLRLSDCELINVSVPGLRRFIQNYNNLQHFGLRHFRLSEEEVEDLCSTLCTMQTLRSVKLTVDRLTERCAASLNLLQKCDNVSSLQVTCNMQLDSGMRVLQEGERNPGVLKVTKRHVIPDVQWALMLPLIAHMVCGPRNPLCHPADYINKDS
ncbi:hypothetical protein HHUSO_G29931 [Huso huso]|uniref:Uncharacterized protein n=1 Tax=Huso huso TaxID=61971 RepID=A0ABR0YF44_HUSHU